LQLNVFLAEGDPALAAWRGGALLAASAEDFARAAVSRQEWQQQGSAAGAEKWGA
jgi:actin-related protein